MKINGKTFFRDPRLWLIAIMLIVMALAAQYALSHPVNYSLRERGNLSYCSAKVTQVVSEEINRNNEGIMRGRQTLSIVPTQGKHKGETLELQNVLTYEHGIYLQQGQTFVACIDESQSGEMIITAFSYQRSYTVLIVTLIFVAVLIFACGIKGLYAALSLAFSFLLLLFVTIPLISLGVSPIPSTLAVLLPILCVSCLLLLGFNKKAIVAFLASFSGILLSAVLFWLISGALHISGYNLDDIETLVVIAQKSSVRIRDLLFSSVLISSLGGILDVTVSVVSSVAEVYAANPSISRRELFRSGFRVGRDITCSTANTLILAFVGEFFITLFLYHIYGVAFEQLINLDNVAIEFGTAMSGTAALTMAAPLAAFLASRFVWGRLSEGAQKSGELPSG